MDSRVTGDMERSVTRRRFLAASSAASVAAVLAGCQRASRVQRIEPEPSAGFHHPYFLAEPETYRAGPVPVLVESNNADETKTREKELSDAKNQSRVMSMQGAWLSEMLGVPHLKTAIPEPSGDAETEAIETAQLDRTAMLHEGSDLERLDRQTLAMVEHAKDTVLADELGDGERSRLHDQFIMYGNSSEAQFAYRMALMHPESILAIACTAVNGTVVLPLERLAGRDLDFEVGVADLADLTGESFDREAFDAVDKFMIQGGEDPKRRLFMDKERALRRNAWDDERIYETARLVFGPRMVEDRLPRCQIAFEKAGVAGQFRVYPGMPHGDTAAMHDIYAFFQRSIAGESVEEFGQFLRLPFDRTITIDSQEDPQVGYPIQFGISGPFPPPEGLVSYTWRVDDEQVGSGPTTQVTLEESGEYDVTLVIETEHDQTGQLGASLLGGESGFAAFLYAVDAPEPRYRDAGTTFEPGETVEIGVEVANVGAVPGERSLEFGVDGETLESRSVQVDAGSSATVTFEHAFADADAGEIAVAIPPAYRETMTVRM